LFELHAADGSLTPIGAAVDCGLSAPVKSLCFAGVSTLVVAADGQVVVLEFAASLAVANRIAAPALTGVLEVVADVANAGHVIVSSQTQRPGGVCVWRVRLDATAKAAVMAPVADENTAANPTSAATPVAASPVVTAAAPTVVVTPTAVVVATKKVASARGTKKATAAAMTRTSSARTPPVAVAVAVAQPPAPSKPVAAEPAAPAVSEGAPRAQRAAAGPQADSRHARGARAQV
jgi:hypothetical protein